MFRKAKKPIFALIAAFLASASACTDISRTINVHTEEFSGEDITSVNTDEDDETLEIVTSEQKFETTADETEPKPEETTAPTSTAKGTTTFPKQTTRAGETTTAATTAAPAATTAAATAETTVGTTAAPSADTTTRAADNTPISYNVIGENGILVSYQNGHYRGIMPCFGTYGLCEKWAGAVNTFAKKLKGVNVYSMTVPISSEFYTPQKYWDSGFTVSQLNKCEHIKENLSGAAYVDAYTTLKEHKDEDIYSRTDHHWTPLGAYYAAGCFAEAAGVDFPSIDDYKPVSRAGYVGSMYTYSKDYHLYNDAETFTMYLPPNVDKLNTTYYNTYFSGAYKGDLFVSRTAASFYCSFIGSDDRVTKVETDVKNGRTLVVFKQSYGNALIPFLTSGFEKIYVCDMRFFDLNGIQFCKDVGATDVLCTDCVMIAAGNGGKYLEYILNK